MSNINMDRGYELTGDELELVAGGGNFGRGIGGFIGGVVGAAVALPLALCPPAAVSVWKGVVNTIGGAVGSFEDRDNAG